MNYTEIVDLAYQYDVLKFDNAKEVINARRPSNPVISTHIWETKFPNNLSIGAHHIEIRAIDMYGQIHYQKTTINVMN